jgi:hypothetical protein
MNDQLAKGAIFGHEKTRSALETMDDKEKDVLFLHFYNYSKQFFFTREIDKAKIIYTVKGFISTLKFNSDDVNRLVELFFRWKQYFDGFEKKVLDILSNNPGSQEYLFLRSSTFLKNRESWEKKGIDDSEDEIIKSYSDYLNRIYRADESLGKYYVIKDNYDSKILANKFTHQLYNLRKTMVVSGFASGEGFSLVPLMIKYEDAYETPIEEHKTWNEEL